MAVRSLNQLAGLRLALLGARRLWLKARHGLEMGDNSSISLSGRLVSGSRGSITVGADTLIAFKTLILSRDGRGATRPVRIGSSCFIGGGAVIMPGVTIGDQVVIAAGAVVLGDIPPRSIAGGNPARVLRGDVEVGKRGRLEGAEERWSKLR